MRRIRFTWFLTALWITFSFLFIVSDAGAYTRDPSGNPASEPFTFTTDAGSDASSNCSAFGYQTIAIQWQPGAPYSTIYFDWHAYSATDSWTDLTCAGNSYEQGDAACSDDFTAYDVLIICNDTPDYDETWGAYVLDSTDFVWELGIVETPTATETATSTDQVYSFPLAIIIFQLAVIVCLLTFRA